MWQKRRFTIEALEPRLVLDSVGIGIPFAGALPVETPSGPYIASTTGVAQVEGRDLFVDVLFEVPPGADANELALAVLQEQGARPFQSAGYTFSGLVWDQFFDDMPGNDFVVQNYNPANDPTGGEGGAALTSSHDTWTNVPSSKFTFSYGGETNRWPSLVRESPGPQTFDGYNDVAWMTLRGGGVLGVTWWGTDVDEADMALNTQFSWSTDGIHDFDVETVFLHENGHVAGLGHSDVYEAVMYAYYDGVQRSLHEDDGNGLAALYPAEPADVHDVAVVAVAAPDFVVVGDTATIDVTVENQGTFSETFDVMLTESPDGFTETQSVTSLEPGASTSVTFSWVTTAGTTLGEHTLSASHNLADDDSSDDSISTAIVAVDEAAVVTVLSVDPNSGSPGEKLRVTVKGTNFQEGATVDFGWRILVQGLSFIDSTQLDVEIKVHPRAAPGPRDVTVTNPDGSWGFLSGGFIVTSATAKAKLGEERESVDAAFRAVATYYAFEQTDASERPSKEKNLLQKAVDHLFEYGI